MIGLEDAADAHAANPAAALVLLLHGGRAKSYEPVRRGNLAALRMSALSRALGSDPRLPVVGLRYRLRGWNDEHGTRVPDPVLDTLSALETIEKRLGPVPVILVGHSLGGRTAVHVSAHPTVRAVAALAPWLPPAEPVEPLRDRTVLIAHGRRDRVTEIEHSIAFAQRAVPVATAVYLKLLDDGHAMLRAAADWHTLVRDFTRTVAFGPEATHLDAEQLTG